MHNNKLWFEDGALSFLKKILFQLIPYYQYVLPNLIQQKLFLSTHNTAPCICLVKVLPVIRMNWHALIHALCHSKYKMLALCPPISNIQLHGAEGVDWEPLVKGWFQYRRGWSEVGVDEPSFLFQEEQMVAKLGMTFFVFSVFPAPDSPAVMMEWLFYDHNELSALIHTLCHIKYGQHSVLLFPTYSSMVWRIEIGNLL